MTFLHSRYNPDIKLSTQDMHEISQEIARNFSPRFSSPMPSLVEPIKLSSMELLDIGNEIRRDFAPKPSAIGTPEMTLLPIDPGHIHAYWNLGAIAGTAQAENDSEPQLVLRVYSHSDESIEDSEDTLSLDLAIDETMTHREITIPVASGGKDYVAAIGKQDGDDKFVELIRSNAVHVSYGKTMANNGSSYCQAQQSANKRDDK